jgi:hypothetical protein
MIRAVTASLPIHGDNKPGMFNLKKESSSVITDLILRKNREKRGV